MEGVDPDTLLEWLQTGVGEERDIQMMALEQLCMLLLMSDNIDRCFESCPPRTFLPALCKIFLDDSAPENVLEVTARAITYYLDVSTECTRRITQVDGAVKAICNRLAVAEMTERSSKDLAEQCVKLLEHVCQRETATVYDAGGMQCMLSLVRQHGSAVHKDTMHSAMAVVTRLCAKMEPSDASLPECSAHLGALLVHDDAKVSECALRCFAALADRFMRKHLDPGILAEHGNLVEQLLSALCGNSRQPALSPFTSVVISLLSNLCRGSASVTDKVVSSPKLVNALRSVLTSKDERCVVDSLRLCDLLLLLLCEGRLALPRSVNAASVSARGLSEATGFDRAHRHLIDSIRQRDTDAVIEAVESNTVDPNFTDDVGQTLLNWASAFGTNEMVIYLCEKGADVNRGQRSSSLHYASCFGRPDIVKVLLRHGANPDLRDEEGKTALDKARERSDEGHQQVVAILESPGAYAAPNVENTQRSTSTSSTMTTTTEETKSTTIESFHDPRLVCALLEQLLPIFCEIFQKSLVITVRRSCLSLMRKTVHHMSSSSLRNLVTWTNGTSGNHFADSLTAVLVTVLEMEEDVDGHEQVLALMKDLLDKDGEFWLEQLIRLGVFERVEALATSLPHLPPPPPHIPPVASAPASLNEQSSTAMTNEINAFSRTESVISDTATGTETPLSVVDESERRHMLNVPIQVEEESLSNTATPPPTVEVRPTSATESMALTAAAAEDSWQLETGKAYRWKDWRLIKSRDSVFFWCDALALELSDSSNGWFRYLLDGRLSIMYSSGSPETGTDSAETRAEFLEKLSRARAAVATGTPLYTICTIVNANLKVEVGNWHIGCVESGELIFTNQEGNQQKLLVRDDVPGFVFESNRHSRHVFTAESTLGPDFVTGWTARGNNRRLRFKTEAQRVKLHGLARDLWDNYLKEARSKPRDALIESQNAAGAIRAFVQNLNERGDKENIDPSAFDLEQLNKALLCVRDSVTDERLLSTFELSVSGIVQALMLFLSAIADTPSHPAAKLFREIFSAKDSLSLFIKKVIAILESNEKFPQFLYDTPGGSPFGLQLLSRRIRLKLERAKDQEGDSLLIDRTGRSFKSEPLATVGQMKSFLLRMVAKQWYDRDRESFEFVHQIRDSKEHRLTFHYQTDFDDQGIIYWLGTNGRTSSDWTNPAIAGVVHVTSSDGQAQPYGRPEDILSRDVNAANCHSTDDKNANFTLDLGVLVYPSAYTLRHARGYGRSALRNWMLQGSQSGRLWDVLLLHSEDAALGDPGSTATWPIASESGKGPYRYLRISQNGKNASGQTHYLSISGFEVYGTIVDVMVADFPKTPQPLDASTASKKLSESRSLPGGTENNKLRSSTAADSTSAGASAPAKSRILRYRRNTGTRSNATPGTTMDIPHPILSVGSRVSRGPDWKWNDQGTAEGTVIAEAHNGWIDIQWDDHTCNSYRYGNDKKYDVMELRGETSRQSNASALLATMRQRGRGLIGNSPLIRRLESNPPTFTSFGPSSAFAGFPIEIPIPVQRNERHLPPRSETKTKQPFPSKYVSSPSQKNNVASSPSQKNNVASSNQSNTTKEASLKLNTNSSNAATISQKSMSTTNLFDGPSESGITVASTNQAASAESLQHQTPSLENLLARSRLFDDRIPEVLHDESPSTTPEPALESAHGSTQTVSTDQADAMSNEGLHTLDTSSESVDSPANRSQPEGVIRSSVAASTITGGSQPVLSVSRIEVVDSSDETVDNASSSSQLTPTAEKGQSMLSERDRIEEMNARNLASASSPDLATPRQSADSSTTTDEARLLVEDDTDGDGHVTPPAVQQSTANETVSVIAQSTGHPETANAAKRLGDDRIASSEEGPGAALMVSSREAYNELMDMYSEVLRATGENEAVATGNVLSDAFLNRLLRSSTSGDSPVVDLGVAIDNSRSHRVSGDGAEPDSPVVDLGVAIDNSRSHRASGDGAESGNRRNIASLGSDLRSRFGSYAEALRSMMQQVIDSGGSISGFEIDHIDSDESGLYREILPIDDAQDEMYEDELDDEGNEDDCDDGFPPPGSLPVDALASAAAALRRQSSNNSTGSSNAETKMTWRQLVLGEAGRAFVNESGRPSAGRSGGESTGGMKNSSSSADRSQRLWDDDFVLKRQFAALIPAFDPRPGRTNVNQTQDVELPPVDETSREATRPIGGDPLATHGRPIGDPSSRQASRIGSFKEQRIQLSLRGPNLTNVENVTVVMDDDDQSIFAYVQRLVQMADWGQKPDKTRRIWEPTYTLIYQESRADETSNVARKRNSLSNTESNVLVTQSLRVVSLLRRLVDQGNEELDVSSEDFISEKLTQKLTQELADPLVVAARALPDWCDQLLYGHPCLFSAETRNMYLKATAFGTSRAIVWLQTRRDQILEQTRGSSAATAGSGMAGSRREDHYPEYRIGRIKHERIKVSRSDDQLLDQAIRVLKFHASRKSVLEIEYLGEEGTGLGPTLEFYALVAAEFQRKSLAMWLCDDGDVEQNKMEESELDLGEGLKPPGYYVRRAGGLFPAPLPRDSEDSRRAAELFRVFGIFLAKVLQDGRIVDLPLARPLLKLLVSEQVASRNEAQLESVIGLDDLEEVHPVKGIFLKQLRAFAQRKRSIESDRSLDPESKRRRLDQLTLVINGNECRVEDLTLSFRLNPSSSVFTYEHMDLVEGGADIDVTMENVDLYLQKCTDFYLNSGISDQVMAFRQGFDLVFPLSALCAFSPEEVQTLLSGEQCPEWSREDLMTYTEPKLGYTRESPGFLRFVDVLCAMDAVERKSFLQFTTGCSSLPPGGLANLHPRLTVVRKVDSGDGSYPSVNTCVHYLKLPEYSSADILRERLLAATNEKGFHLN